MRLMKYLMVLLLNQHAWAGHPADAGMTMQHGTVAVPAGSQIPHIEALLVEDSMDGYNLLLHLTHFELVPPLAGATASKVRNDGHTVLQGHLHLYINGKKVMRLYAPAVHLPETLLKDGMNSITVSVNNHQHETYTWQDKEIQSTLLIDTRSKNLIKNRFVWSAL